MTVIYKRDEQRFTAEEVTWAKKELIEAIVRDALVGKTEAFIDMIIDTERPEEITRASVNETMRGVKDAAGNFLKDVIGDLQFSIEARLREARYGAVVTGLKYDIAGDVKDIEVDVSVSFE